MPDAGTLAGTVLDQTGKAIQGATAIVKNDATGVTSAVTTASDAHFSGGGPPGSECTIDAMAVVFAKTTRAGSSFPRVAITV
jgi:hypothetical protein